MSREIDNISDEVFVYRLKFRRSEPAIWLGHLDMMRTFERSLRRAGIPLAWSQGYNPRPQMVFALPISVGLAAEGELLDVNCSEQLVPADFVERLDAKLPQGLSVDECEQIVPGRHSLMSLVKEAVYRIETDDICAVAENLLGGSEPLITEKTRKGKTAELDIRPLLISWECCSANCLQIRVKAGSSSNLRPDLLLKLFVEQGNMNQIVADDAYICRRELILSE